MASCYSVWAAVAVLTMSYLGTFHFASAQLCKQGSMSSRCQCVSDQPGTFKIACSCVAGQDLTISDMATLGLPATVTSIHIHNCSNSVTLTSNALEGLDTLENITFQSINHLTLEPRSLDLVFFHQNNFTLTFDSVSDLSLKQNAIQLQGEGGPNMKMHVIIRNSFITDLQQNAIVGSLSELRLERVILSQAPASRAINVGPEDASVSIDIMDATTQGLSSEWITGNMSRLSVANSSLTLLPGAFAGVHMQVTPNSRFIFRNNQLGYPKWYPGNNSTTSVPSLPTRSLDLKVPREGIFTDASNNRITCSCQDIVWFLEDPMTTLKFKIKRSVKCVEGNIASAISKCGESSGLAPINTLNLTLFFLTCWAQLILS